MIATLTLLYYCWLEAAAIAALTELYFLSRFTFIWTRGKKNKSITQPIKLFGNSLSIYLCSLWVILLVIGIDQVASKGSSKGSSNS